MPYLLSIILCLSLSPIWPLGDNPRAGDPFIIVNKATNKLAYIDDGKIQRVFYLFIEFINWKKYSGL